MTRQGELTSGFRSSFGFDPHPKRAGQAVLDGAAKRAIETGRKRLLVAGMVFACAFLAVGIRLIDVSTSGAGASVAALTLETQAKPAVTRADIVDRNGVLLAATLPSSSLYAVPRQIADAARTAERLSQILPELSPVALEAKLATDRGFVWVKRNLSPRQAQSVNHLGVPGLYFRDDQARFYPHGALTAHAVGLTDVDNKGIAGIERSFEERLTDGTSALALSLDLRIQHILAEELATGIADFNGIGGAGLVLDVRSGEILAMISLPTFSPDRPAESTSEARFNRTSLGVYEMGSLFKIFTTAMVLDTRSVGLSDSFDVSEPIRVAGFSIRDFKPKKRSLSVPEIFIYSSNIGTVQMAMTAGTPRQRSFLKGLGLMRKASLELPEVGYPMVPSPWREINSMTISYGHGMAVSAIQLASAVAAIVNGGELVPATLIKRRRNEPYVVQRVVRPETSDKLRWLMRLAVQHGTGRKAEAEGYLVGGKTGTADKLVGRRYAKNARVASFVGAFPMDDPRYVVFAMIDEPKGKKNSFGYATGGWVAAPVVSRVVTRMASLLGIEPRSAEEVAVIEQSMIPPSAKGFVLAAY